MLERVTESNYNTWHRVSSPLLQGVTRLPFPPPSFTRGEKSGLQAGGLSPYVKRVDEDDDVSLL